MRKLFLHIVLISAIIGTSAYIFLIPYNELKQKSIDSLNEKQYLLAKQVARSITDFFSYYSNSITHLSRHPEIINFNRNGITLLNEYLNYHKNDITAITRVSSGGRIIYTAPYRKKSIGANISEQEHNRLLIEKKKPIVSEVFKTVQGYNAIAFAIPIVRRNTFKGALSILISIDKIGQRYCSDIRIGKGGYAWILSKKGREIYCPVPGHIGKTIYETSGKFPSIIRMAEKMMKGESGSAKYFYDMVREKSIEVIKKHAVYYPINLPNNYWSVVVATPESHTLNAVKNFKNKWLLISLVIGIIFLSYFSYNIWAGTILKEKSLRLESEEALRESEEKFRVIAEQSRMGIIISRNYLFTYINNAASDIFEYTIEEMMKWGPKEYEKLVHPDFKDFVIGQSGKSDAENKERVINTEWKAITGSGREIWIESFSIPIKIGNSSADLIVLIDITARKKSQELVLHSEKMMTIENLAAGMAHELNNPLGVILQGIQIIENRCSPDLDKNKETADKCGIDMNRLKSYVDERGITQYLKGISEAGSKAARIVSEMVHFSKKRSSKPVMRDINMLIDNTIDIALKDYEMKKKFNFRNIEIKKDYSAPPPRAICIHNEIEQVVLNILKNSAQALSEDKEKKKPIIRIKSGLDENSVFFEISDNGPGMNEYILKHIFDPFFTTKEVGQGTGLGLYVAYFFVTTHHNGTITVDSKPGQGATFRVNLPQV